MSTVEPSTTTADNHSVLLSGMDPKQPKKRLSLSLPKGRHSSIEQTSESIVRSTSVKTTHCSCGSPLCEVCKVEVRIMCTSTEPAQKRRRISTINDPEVGEEVDLSDDDAALSTISSSTPSTLETYIDILESAPDKLHVAMIRISPARVDEYKAQGSEFCSKNCCLADTTKDEEPVYSFLQRTDTFSQCGRTGACRYNCVGACRRHAAYKAFAQHIKAKERTVLPICVRVYINELFGPSVVGYKPK